MLSRSSLRRSLLTWRRAESSTVAVFDPVPACHHHLHHHYNWTLLDDDDHRPKLLRSAANFRRRNEPTARGYYSDSDDQSHRKRSFETLMNAASTGDISFVAEIIGQDPALCWEKAQVGTAALSGQSAAVQIMSPFMVACQNGYVHVVELMLSTIRGEEDVYLRDNVAAVTPVFQYNALHLAVLGCAWQKHPMRHNRSWGSVVERILALDSDLASAMLYSRDDHGFTPAMIASQFGLTHILHTMLSFMYRNFPRTRLAELVNIRGRENKEMALHVAAKENHADVCQLLLAAGACRESHDRFGRTFVDIATVPQASQVLSLIGDHFAHGNAYDIDRASLVWFGDASRAKDLDNVRDAFGTNAQMSASADADLDKLCAVRESCSFDVNERNVFHWTALIYAMADDSFHVPMRDQVVSTLLEMGSDPNVITVDGLVPLDLCNALHSSTVKKLLQCGADVNYKSEIDGHSPLHTLLGKDIVNLDSIRLILGAGADVNAETHDGMRPLHVACIKQHARVVELLLEHEGLDVNAVHTETGDNALVLAAASNNLRIVKLLATRHVDVNRRSKKGMTALIYAVHHGNAAMIDYLVRTAGARIDLRSPEADTILKYAVISGRADIVLRLLKLAEPRWRRGKGRRIALAFARTLVDASNDENLRASVGNVVAALNE